MSELKRGLDIQKKVVPMPKQEPEVRRRNFDEVALGYTEEQAVAEASRCLQCPEPKCVKGCSIKVDVPAFIELITNRRFEEAIMKIRERNSLPAICGRVCPQEEQCQKFCVLGSIGDPINIGGLERFVADRNLQKNFDVTERAKSTGKAVAVIGSGPAGLTVASDLAKLGHDVTIFEALHMPGGVLVYGIPEFRLPKSVVQAEIDYVKKLGVRIRTNCLIGRTYTISDLFELGFDAVFIGTGAGLPQFLGVPGENLCGVYSANEFLIRVNLMKSYMFPEYDTPIKVGEKVSVIGGGNVAMDCARSAIRLGSKEVCVVYRRSREEMPAKKDEIKNAEEEGVTFRFLAAPVKFIGDERGWVKAMECVRMGLGPLDESGRRRPIPIKGSEFTTSTDTVIIAIGRTPNPIIQRTTDGLSVTEWGTIVTDDSCRTSLKGVYAGGDVVTGEATVISAMEAGKRAAVAIHEYLMRA